MVKRATLAAALIQSEVNDWDKEKIEVTGYDAEEPGVTGDLFYVTSIDVSNYTISF